MSSYLHFPNNLNDIKDIYSLYDNLQNLFSIDKSF